LSSKSLLRHGFTGKPTISTQDNRQSGAFLARRCGLSPDVRGFTHQYLDGI